jgi:hypothetical protein
MDGVGRGSKLRSFAIGGVVGAAGAIATVRRSSRQARRPSSAPAGLAAFENAPCFLELLGDETPAYRDAGGETDTALPNPEPLKPA